MHWKWKGTAEGEEVLDRDVIEATLCRNTTSDHMEARLWTLQDSDGINIFMSVLVMTPKHRFPLLVLRYHRPACSVCFPVTTHLIQTNGSPQLLGIGSHFSIPSMPSLDLCTSKYVLLSRTRQLCFCISVELQIKFGGGEKSKKKIARLEAK